MPEAEFYVETDETGFTFVHGDDLPYFVVDDLESFYMNELPRPDGKGEFIGPFSVEWDTESETVQEWSE